MLSRWYAAIRTRYIHPLTSADPNKPEPKGSEGWTGFSGCGWLSPGLSAATTNTISQILPVIAARSSLRYAVFSTLLFQLRSIPLVSVQPTGWIYLTQRSSTPACVNCITMDLCHLVLCAVVQAAVWGNVDGSKCCPENQRVECGFPGITPAQCDAKNCCFNNEVHGHWCSEKKCAPPAPPAPPTPSPPKPPPQNYTNIEVLHVINSCHLDIGFADSSQGIINR